MPIPDYQTLMLPMLQYGSDGVISFREAVERASNDFNLTDEEREETRASEPEGTKHD